MQEEIRKTVKFAFEHSTARALLIFSGLLVIFSMGYAKEFVSVAFFTFFYALVAYKIIVLRKAEVWGNYAVGDTLGAILYFLVDLLFFVSWIIGTIFLLSGAPLVSLLFYCQFGTFFISALIVSASWIALIFLRAIREERKKKV